MNSLSWLLYAADVADTIRIIGGIAIPLGVLGGVAAMPLSFLAGDTYSWHDEDEKRAIKARPAVVRGVAAKVLIACAALAVIVTFTPSRNTIMLIAASEVGETVLASPQARQIGGEAGELAADSLRVLRKFINEQLEGEE